MVTLAHLPPEVLALICQASDALTLWQTGDQRLRAALSKGGVQTLELVNVLECDSVTFPEATQSFFGLRELIIERGGHILTDVNQLTSAVLSLPPSLTRLYLHCEDASTLFLRHSLPAGSSSQWTSRRSVIGMVGTERRTHDLNTRFPRLQTLELVWDNEPYRIFSKSDLAALPPTLTSLRLPSFDTYEAEVFSALPQSLTRLHLGATRRISPEALSNLPRASLTRIDDDSPKLAALEEEHIASLPPSLTEWPSRGLPTLWTPQLASIMPRHFAGTLLVDFLLSTTLDSWKPVADPLLEVHRKVGYEPIADAHLSRPAPFEPSIITLPTSLTRLRLWVYPESAADAMMYFDSRLFALLPRSLITLELFSFDWNGAHLVPRVHWPPRLSTLRIRSEKGFEPRVASNLPDTLTSLSNFEGGEPEHGYGSALQNITELLPFLPTSLTEIHAYWPDFSDMMDAARDVEQAVEIPDALQRFNKLSSLSLLTSVYQPLHRDALPKSLTHLAITTDAQWDAAAIALLPRGLKSFELDSQHSFLVSDAIPLLPPSLNHLQIPGFLPPGSQDHYTTLTSITFEGLPNTLRSLHMSGTLNYAPQAFANLPPSLRTLSCSHIAAEACILLPRGLATLNADFSLKGFKNLPPRILRQRQLNAGKDRLEALH